MGQDMPQDQDNVYTVEELRRIVLLPLVEKHEMQEAHLFGSYARGEADASSDIGLLLLLLTGKPEFRPLSVYAVSAEVMEATGKMVDVYEMCELDPDTFKDSILADAVLL